MNTLRVKIALLLVIAIVTVVGLLTVVLFYLLGPPQRIHSLSPVAQQIETVLRVVDEGSAAISLVPQPSPGRLQERVTWNLRDTLGARGVHLAVRVTRDGWRAPLVVSIPVGRRGWVLMPMTDVPPQGAPWRGLIRWLILITLGATAIAVFVANRMVRPLALLESAVARPRRRAAHFAGARSGGGPGHRQGAEHTLDPAQAGDGEPDAAGGRGRARSPHADHPHAAQGRIRRG